MVIFKKIADLQNYLNTLHAAGRQTGFIPTMGALHAGHISLIDKARAAGLTTVCSIFLNPTQFNDKKDLEKYPVSTAADIEALTDAGCDILFLPSVDEIYPGGEGETRTYDFGYLDTILEGATRPGHFKGVGQVVARLLSITTPDKLFLGQKDYQQCMVITKLVDILGTGAPEIVIGDTVREADGLAMSSRNRRLTEPQRIVAAVIYQCLISIESKQHTDRFDIVKKQCEDLLKAKGFAVEYVALANAGTLQLLDDYQPGAQMVALIAAKIGEIRLIDNILIKP